MKKIALLIILGFGILTSTKAQSVFLDQYQNGVGVIGGFSTNKDATGFSGSFGYSFSGVFDLGLSVGRFGSKELLLGEKSNTTVISPFISYLIVKQNEQTPVSFSLNASYQREIFSNKLLSDNNWDMNANLFTIGASLSSMFYVSESMKIMPSIGFRYFTGELKLEGLFVSETESISSTVFTIGLPLVFQTSQNNTFVATPSLGLGENNTTFGLSLGFIFPQN